MTVNSDDPAYFGGYLLDNYVAVQRALGLSRADLAQLARNSITASLLPGERKAGLIAEIDLVAAAPRPERACRSGGGLTTPPATRTPAHATSRLPGGAE